MYASSEKLQSEPRPPTAWHQASEMSWRGDSANTVWKHLAKQLSLLISLAVPPAFTLSIDELITKAASEPGYLTMPASNPGKAHIKWRDIIFLFRSDFHRLFGSVFLLSCQYTRQKRHVTWALGHIDIGGELKNHAGIMQRKVQNHARLYN